MAGPTSFTDVKTNHRRIITIPAQVASFDLNWDVNNLVGFTLSITGTIGGATQSLQVSADRVNFTDAALLQTNVVGHTELKALTIALSPYAMRLEDLAYPFFNIHHTAGGGSSVAFVVVMTEGRLG
jgi:hypothetical protein